MSSQRPSSIMAASSSRLLALTHDDARAGSQSITCQHSRFAQRAVLVLGGIGVVRVHLHGGSRASRILMSSGKRSPSAPEKELVINALQSSERCWPSTRRRRQHSRAVRMGRDAPALANGAIWNHVAKRFSSSRPPQIFPWKMGARR